ncbi:M4 family metallopeptidase [Myxococcus sp. RHSTA-1-4]|uniref:M4 family metallopeptidase n=1 Tax=Myxococcus sp. RHSTA-1-4 TaxID=2874601 RepID=UPI001CBB6410|nr:M4 family metallopeptidase [Myxococcus sp. RHSTA-1-4]MBZ4418036.1 M4 family metallopeptidase [Myxococcus sp. RHSTA-1-4]
MMQSRVRGALGVAALSFLVGACNEAAPAAGAKAPETGSRTQKLENGASIFETDKAGAPTFIGGELGILPVVEATAPESLQAAQLAPVVANVASMLRLEPGNLSLKKAYKDTQGDVHYRFDVSHQGIPVFGGELRLHARDGKVFAANTNVRSDLKAAAKASIAGEAAVAAAASDRDALAGYVTHPETELVYWRDGDELRLMYKVEQTGEKPDGTPVRDILLVDATTGDVQVRIPTIHEAINRRMHNGANLSTLPGAIVRIEGEAPVADAVVNTNYDHLGTVYNCYNGLFGRDSYNNAGAVLISTVHHRVRYVNAFWNGTQMVYGDGDDVTATNLANSLDVTAHELTHAVTDTESDLIYSGESGGLNESMSDIFGAVCEWYGDGAGDVNARHWLIGDDIWTPSIPNDALRYMHSPTIDGVSLDYYPDYSSGVDVHYSSGISNLAFYLLSQGGTHPRGKTTQAVAGIGIEKAARIFYKANVDILLSNATFDSAKIATEQAAQQLGYDAATIASVGNAWKAVGVGVPVPPPTNTPMGKDVPLTNLSGTRSSKQYFSVEVPEGAYDLKFTMSGGTGDADMYVRYASAPTTTQYNCRPYSSGNNETCSFAAPTHGTWYVMLNGFSAYSGVSLVVTWKGGYLPIEPGVEITGLSGAAGSSQVFTVQIPELQNNPEGLRNVHVNLRGTGNADLYVQRAGAPSAFAYDCRGVNEHSTEVCNLNGFQPGKYYIQVFGAKGGFTDGSLIVTFN